MHKEGLEQCADLGRAMSSQRGGTRGLPRIKLKALLNNIPIWSDIAQMVMVMVMELENHGHGHQSTD